MRFLFQAPPGLGFFDLSGVRLMLDGPAKAQAGSSSVILKFFWFMAKTQLGVAAAPALNR